MVLHPPPALPHPIYKKDSFGFHKADLNTWGRWDAGEWESSSLHPLEAGAQRWEEAGPRAARAFGRQMQRPSLCLRGALGSLQLSRESQPIPEHLIAGGGDVTSGAGRGASVSRQGLVLLYGLWPTSRSVCASVSLGEIVFQFLHLSKVLEGIQRVSEVTILQIKEL